MANPANPRRQPEPRRGIRSIAVKGFKSIGEQQQLDIKPLTMLAGANSAGKSSILQPLLLLKQTLESAYDPGPLLLHGPCVRFTSADQFFSHGTGTRRLKTFFVELESSRGPAVRMSYRRVKNKGLQIESMSFRNNKRSEFFEISSDMEEPEILRGLPKDLRRVYERTLERFSGTFQWKIVRDRCFLRMELKDVGGQNRQRFLTTQAVSPSKSFAPDLLNIIHVPGLRGNPERSYKTTAIEDHFPGTFEPYIASILNHWKRHNNSELTSLGKDLQTLGLTWKVSAQPIDETQVEIHVGRLPKATQGGAHDLVNIADVGFGLSQTLPVVVALRVAEKGRLVYIEQPELHLHPRAQVAMASLLLDAAKRGVRVVVETHSAVLLRAVQTAVAQGAINPDDVGLNWFERDPKSGLTTVQRADLDENGSFGDWPEDFDNVTLNIESAYLDAIEARMAG